MVSVLAFIHIVLSIFLVVLVLIQDPKGGGAGGLFGGGGGSNSLFGATGAPSFLARVTRWVAVVFATSCIAMTIFIKPGGKSVLDAETGSTPSVKQEMGVGSQEAAPENQEASPAANEEGSHEAEQ